jgi:hypothetical protein
MLNKTRYDTTLEKAQGFDRLETAMKQGYAESQRSAGPEFDEGYLALIRAKAANAVYAHWNATRQPASLAEIYSRTINSLKNDPLFNNRQLPSKRTIDRRVNEAADRRFYPTGAPIVCIRPGTYLPNPRNFSEPARTLLTALVGQ